MDLSLCNKNSDLIFLEIFTRKGGMGYLPIFSRILVEKVGGRNYLPIFNLFDGLIVTYRSKKSNAVDLPLPQLEILPEYPSRVLAHDRL